MCRPSENTSTKMSCPSLKTEILWKSHEKICAKKVCHDQQGLPIWNPLIQSCQEFSIMGADSFTQNMSKKAAAIAFCRPVRKCDTYQKIIKFSYEIDYSEKHYKILHWNNLRIRTICVGFLQIKKFPNNTRSGDFCEQKYWKHLVLKTDIVNYPSLGNYIDHHSNPQYVQKNKRKAP